MDADSFSGSNFANLAIIEEIFEKYKKDPAAVDPSWRDYFNSLEKTDQLTITAPHTERYAVPAEPPKSLVEAPRDLRIGHLIEAFRSYGHLLAGFNPLITTPVKEPNVLTLKALGFNEHELPDHFPACGLLEKKEAALQEILDALKSIYCGRIGFEYAGLGRPLLEKWLQEKVETKSFKKELSIERKKKILESLNKSELFESFLHTKYVGQKRFSLEGGETLIPVMETIIERGAELGIDELVLGMAHRGRLNVLSNILQKSYSDIFSEFDDGYIPESFEGSGDVKYHKGFYSQTSTDKGHKVQITLTPNPSHLEAVDPVVEGQTYAKQVMKNDDRTKEKVLPILVHGDAALSGQGIVYETLQFADLEGYGTGGTIHIVINNQIGFTTVPKDARSTFYATDIAHSFSAPVFHVNAEDPEGCVQAALLAIEIRQKFHCDIFIDMLCYRKYGHNEADEPAYTQPQEYKIIRAKPSIREIYRDDLIQQGIVERQMAEALEAEFKKSLQEALKLVKITPPKPKEEKPKPTQEPDSSLFRHIHTGVPADVLREIAAKALTPPDGFTIHPKLKHLMKDRMSMTAAGDTSKPIDWGMGEMLAFGSLLWDGYHVRLSGQDSCRGTFSHRHAMWMDQEQERPYYPLKHLKEGQGRFDVFNSPLSEYAVLGFEFGYSLAYQDALVLWEAQFGDFSNGAQVIIDQFISTCEQKWGLKFSLTLLLPHGYEGQGPEHSSARLERFLSLSGNNNLQVVYPSTPAQLFHLLRRQVLRPLKKPLIVFTPKGLLRHPECVSKLEEFTLGSFKEILDDPSPPEKVERLVFCSGRIYYDLAAERSKTQTEDLAIVRIEQLYPFHQGIARDLLSKYHTAQKYYWIQEEPSNMGAEEYIKDVLAELLPRGADLSFIARPRSASPAAGSHALHKKEHALLLEALFGQKQPSIFDLAGQQKKH